MLLFYQFLFVSLKIRSFFSFWQFSCVFRFFFQKKNSNDQISSSSPIISRSKSMPPSSTRPVLARSLSLSLRRFFADMKFNIFPRKQFTHFIRLEHVRALAIAFLSRFSNIFGFHRCDYKYRLIFTHAYIRRFDFSRVSSSRHLSRHPEAVSAHHLFLKFLFYFVPFNGCISFIH